jgi:hypothetical protein
MYDVLLMLSLFTNCVLVVAVIRLHYLNKELFDRAYDLGKRHGQEKATQDAYYAALQHEKVS